MNYIIYQFIWLFLVYSFLGWVLETTTAATKQKRFTNRGIINGPFCVIYGITAILLTILTQELHGFWLFLGCVIVSTLVEFIAGHIVEKFYHKRWWDYSNSKWNLDGYICLSASIFWGVLGFLAMQWGNDFFLSIMEIFPNLITNIVLLLLLGLVFLDGAATAILLSGKSRMIEKWEATDAWMDSLSTSLGDRIYNLVDRRLQGAYPTAKKLVKTKSVSTVFAEGCSFYKIAMLFFIGAFLGDIIETIFCRISMGEWMSRSSVVWGPFSIVWGLAIAAVTALFYKYRNNSDRFLFWMGTFVGGAYEYSCSVFTELLFDKVFWDYSDIPFNLAGRINLLYCFFWGIAAIVWFKGIYPFVSKWIEKIPKLFGKCLTWLLLIFMTVNILMSCAALIRYNARSQHKPANNSFTEWIDEHFDDERILHIYPNML